MKTLYLYSTPGCHLCDKAKDILWPLLDEYPLRLEEIDIAETDELVERYGVRIPVLAIFSPSEKGAEVSVSHELNWPFDAARAREFLAEHWH